MFRLVPRIWILFDHFWLVTELLTGGFEDVVEQDSDEKDQNLSWLFAYHWYMPQKCL